MTEPKKISYSQYSMWANCSKSWQLKYVDGHRFDDSTIHTLFGTVFHETVQEWLEILYNKSELLAIQENLQENFKAKLLTAFKESITLDEGGNKVFLCDKTELMNFYTQGVTILDYIKKNRNTFFPTEDVRLFGIEHEINVEVKKNVNFIAYVDIITHNTADDTYKIYDLKTSKSGWSSYQKTDLIKISQILLYKKFLSETLNIPLNNITVEYLIVKRIIPENTKFKVPIASSFAPPNGKPSVTKAWEGIHKFITECFDDEGNYSLEHIKPAANKNACRWCVYRDRKDLCPDGVK